MTTDGDPFIIPALLLIGAGLYFLGLAWQTLTDPDQ